MKRKSLHKNEWAFHRLKESGAAELRAAWLWEIQREAARLAGDKVAPAWFGLKASAQKKIIAAVPAPAKVSREMMLREIPLENLTPEFIEIRQDARDNQGREIPEQLHAFIIDWSKGKNALVEAFETWLRSHPNASRTWPDWEIKSGNKSYPYAWLTDLAIYRVAKAGTGRDKAILLQYVHAATDSQKSKSHWSDAIRRTKARLAEYDNPCARGALLARQLGFVP